MCTLSNIDTHLRFNECTQETSKSKSCTAAAARECVTIDRKAFPLLREISFLHGTLLLKYTIYLFKNSLMLVDLLVYSFGLQYI